MASIKDGLQNLVVTILASIIQIIVGIIYFLFTVIIVKFGASWAGYPSVEGTTVVLTAGIITAASMLGAALQK